MQRYCIKKYFYVRKMKNLLSDTKRQIHQTIFYWALIVIALALPVWPFVTSVAQVVLLLNWVIEGGFNRKFTILKQRKSILIILSLFLIHLVWLVSTKDFEYAFNDIKAKLTLFILPIVIGTSTNLSFKQVKKILLFFISAVIIASIVATFIRFRGVDNIREISVFISHIRFALLINVAICAVFYFLFGKFQLKKIERMSYYVILIWLIIFLFFLYSLTGLLVLFILSIILTGYRIKQTNNIILRRSFYVLLLIIPLAIGFYLSNVVNQFYTISNVQRSLQDEVTAKGNPYYHDWNNKLIQNGNYIYVYICEAELEEEWSKVSRLDFNNMDKKGQELKHTLIHYMTSKGLRKDAEGFSELTQEDLELIEKGKKNYIEGNKFSVYAKLYDFIWEIDLYLKTGHVNGYSKMQRIEYLKAGIGIIKTNFWFGTGTGDVKFSFNNYYKDTNSRLLDQYRLRAHNQFITFFIAFGLVGFILICIIFIYPIILENKQTDFLLMTFFVIAMLSMLWEDTLETQVGATFFSFFYSVFVFYNDKENNNNIKI